MDKKTCEKHPSHKKHLPRLNRVLGQLEGVKKMIEEERYCPEILMQLRAIRAAVRSLEIQLLDTHLSDCVVDAMLQDAPEKRNQKIEEMRKVIKSFE